MNSFTSSLARSASITRARSLSQSSGTGPIGKRFIHATKSRQAIQMPYLSPLMTEGTISSWKKKEGDAFLAGDVLLSIESDFHTVDIQAVNSGILGRILMPDGSQGVKVEEIIALVAKDAQELATMRSVAQKPAPPASSQVPSLPSLQPINPGQTAAEIISPRAITPRPSSSRLSASSHLEQSTNPMFPSAHRTHSPIIHDVRLPMDGDGAHAGVHTSATQSATAAASKLQGHSDDGVAIRRMMRDKFASHSRKPSTGSSSASSSQKKCTTTAYFDGIL